MPESWDPQHLDQFLVRSSSVFPDLAEARHDGQESTSTLGSTKLGHGTHGQQPSLKNVSPKRYEVQDLIAGRCLLECFCNCLQEFLYADSSRPSVFPTATRQDLDATGSRAPQGGVSEKAQVAQESRAQGCETLGKECLAQKWSDGLALRAPSSPASSDSALERCYGRSSDQQLDNGSTSGVKVPC